MKYKKRTSRLMTNDTTIKVKAAYGAMANSSVRDFRCLYIASSDSFVSK
jgi:hypothetical protein